MRSSLELLRGRGLLVLGLGEQRLVDVVEHATLRDGHLVEVLGELLVVADGKLQLARPDAAPLVVTGLRLSLPSL